MEYPTELLLLVSLIAPVVVGLNEVIKQSLNIPKNLIPLVALFIGLLVGVVAEPFSTMDVYLRMWAGVIAGLSSTGIYEVGKKREGHTLD